MKLTGLERVLRKLIRDEWVGPGRSFIWQEAGFGATFGIPDVILADDIIRMPVELKWWEETSKGVKMEMRPAQRRYHLTEAIAGRRTAIMFGVGYEKDYELCLIPGFACPKSDYPKWPVMARIKHTAQDIEECLFNSQSFWTNDGGKIGR